MIYFMLFITNIGSPTSFFLLSMVLIGTLWIHGKKKDARDFFWVMSISAIAVVVIKWIIQRQRPPVTFISEIGYSFPSAHAMLALVFFLCIALFYESHFKSKILKNIFIFSNIAIIVLISYSRVYLGVHYWSDILGSILIGSVIFLSYYRLRKKRKTSKNQRAPIIIGITGTIGSGKGTVVDLLRKKIPFNYFSVREFLTKEINIRKMPVNRDSMKIVADDLRVKFSPSYITDQLFKEAYKKGGNAIIESIRVPGEITSLRALSQKMSEKVGRSNNGSSFFLLAVEASPEARYARIQKRGSSTDSITFETFLEHDSREAESKDPTKMNMTECRTMADYVLENNTSVSELEEKIDLFLKTL